MVYHALDSPDDDYHALFVLCLLYAMSHNKGRCAPSLPRAWDTAHALQHPSSSLMQRALWEGTSFLASVAASYMFFFSLITVSQVFSAD